ncbi:MAG: peptidoglycan DD-metalloendopeptidase family protein [Bacteroidales bacterium]|jgi:murein DD-endopeptidase MepM/ murein hydrolase activator NlpD|nr:peptidoglycan DD-metalloendopeptidase family protein [Bacteroidales bacterium]
MAKTFYHFNTNTLSFEKVKLSVKDIVKRVLWLFASALTFAVIFIWIAFYLIDSPKEKMLQQENEQLKEQLQEMDNQLNLMSEAMADIENRDDNIYRVIFEADPMPVEERYPKLYEQNMAGVGGTDALALLQDVSNKANQLIVRLSAQSHSFDTIAEIAQRKSDMLTSIPAIRPLKGVKTISSGFGGRYHPILKTIRMHTGVDLSAPKGTPVYATADGVVSREKGGSGYGIVVILNHGYSYQTLYAHLSKKVVKPGQKVKRGQLIGYVGNTGLSFGTHLHYEVIKNGVKVNPVHYFFDDITPEEYDAILESSKIVNQALS